MHNTCPDAICDIVEDNDSDDDNAFDSELFNLTQSGDDNDPLCENAEKEIRQDHLETIWAAENGSGNGTERGKGGPTVL